MSKLAKTLQAAAGNAGGAEYIEDVFSTYLYTGNGSTQTINNGIDLAGEGGLVWTKKRNSATDGNHILFDTERVSGVNDYWLSTNNTSAQLGGGSYIDYNSDGFHWTFGSSSWNSSGNTFASWTFRKAPKFFDVLVHTAGTSVVMNHDLGVVPGCIIVKNTGNADQWGFFHRGTNGYMFLNLTNAADGTYQPGIGSNIASSWVGATETTVDFSNWYNANTDFVAYLFAHDAGGFGDDGEQNVISCGSVVTGNVSTDVVVNLGYEPQWILMKRTDSTSQWFLVDVMRKWIEGSSFQANALYANLSNAEGANTNFVKPTATGFTVTGDNLGDAATWIYIAIRRPMKTPESGTEVFAVNVGTSTGVTSSFTTDLVFPAGGITGDTNYIGSRLQGGNAMNSYSSGIEQDLSSNFVWDRQTGWGTNWDTYYAWMFKRAPGFMDVVAYTGTGVAHAEPHNLGVVPELMIVKTRSNAVGWAVSCGEVGYTNGSRLELADLFYSEPNRITSTPTTTTFSIGTDAYVNVSNRTYIAYLFASLPGVSKVGSYTGTGADLNVDCGFSAGARFILIKQTDGNGDWRYWDSVRGITTGNDPFLRYNSSAGQQTGTDLVEPLPSGFIVTGNGSDPGWDATNKLNSTYIFLAIA